MTDAIIYDTDAIAAALRKLEQERRTWHLDYDPREPVAKFAFRVFKDARFRERLRHEADADLDEADFIPSDLSVGRYIEYLKRNRQIVEPYAAQQLKQASVFNILRVMSRLVTMQLITLE